MKLLPILAGAVLLQACATAASRRSKELRELSSAQLEARLRQVPGVNAETRIYTYDTQFVAAPYAVMEDLYSQTRVVRPGSLDLTAWDCDKYARLAAAEVDYLWAKSGGRKPLAQGSIIGRLPVDYENAHVGQHALNWFIDSDNRFWLRGSIERSVLNQSALERIEVVHHIIVG